MKGELVPVPGKILDERAAPPAIVTENGKAAAFAYAEFFGAAIESVHTYRAYRQAVDGFLSWGAARQVALQVVDDRVQGTVLVIGRAAKLHARHPVLPQLLCELLHQPRFADAGLAAPFEAWSEAARFFHIGEQLIHHFRQIREDTVDTELNQFFQLFTRGVVGGGPDRLAKLVHLCHELGSGVNPFRPQPDDVDAGLCKRPNILDVRNEAERAQIRIEGAESAQIA
jgi:hypothetical protein